MKIAITIALSITHSSYGDPQENKLAKHTIFQQKQY
jgi:hypothetical protein